MRFVVYVAGIALILILLVAVVVARVSRSRLAPSNATVPPNQGSAHYALGSVDTRFSVTVESVHRDVSNPSLPPLTAGTRNVRVTVRFANGSPNQQRADWHDFVLRDATGQVHGPIFAPGTPCQEWPMTDLIPPEQQSSRQRDAQAQRAGASFGPVPLCFQAAGPPLGPLTLVWDPDVSFPLLDSPTEIPLVAP